MHWKHWSAIGGLSIALSGPGWGQAPQAGCASTPAAAIEVARAGQKAASQATGYRVESVRWDAAQRRTWAVIRSCDHAERPSMAMLADLPHGVPASVVSTASVPSSAADTSAHIMRGNGAVPMVHAGEVVRLWRADGQAHIELTATAEENGALGAKVRLRLLTPKEADGQYAPPRYFAGIVRGPADVEMER